MNAVVEDTVKALKTNLAEACDTVQSSTQDGAYATLRQVRKHPGTALGIAALAGVVLGLLIRQRG